MSKEVEVENEVDTSLPTVLVLGGTGFIGRNFVKYLVDNKLASKIRVVDKNLPILSYMNDDFKKIFNNPIVEFKQHNLSSKAHIPKAFSGQKFNYIVNLAGETTYGQSDATYTQMIYELSCLCMKEAKKVGCDKYIEFSTSQIYSPSKKPLKESSTQKPWTKIGNYKQKVEKELEKMSKDDGGFPYIIIRPAIVYGPGDKYGLMPRIVCGASYTKLKEKMKLLWSGDLKINSVHVRDVAKATWFLLQKGKIGQAYNLCDKSDLNQKKFNLILSKIFGIKTGFLGNLLSNLAKLNMTGTAEYANGQHMNPWSEMLKDNKIAKTPLSPYIDIELLSNNHQSYDGSLIEKLGFTYDHPKIDESLVRESIKYYTDLKLFPDWENNKKKE